MNQYWKQQRPLLLRRLHRLRLLPRLQEPKERMVKDFNFLEVLIARFQCQQDRCVVNVTQLALR